MTTLFTVRSYNKAGEITREIGCELAKDAIAVMDADMHAGAYRSEAFNNHYKLVQLTRHSNRLRGG